MKNDLEQIKQISIEVEKVHEQMIQLDNQLEKIINKHKDDNSESMHQIFDAMPECHTKFKLFRIMQQKNFI